MGVRTSSGTSSKISVGFSEDLGGPCRVGHNVLMKKGTSPDNSLQIRILKTTKCNGVNLKK